ncbi:MAG: ABC transporter [Methanobacteriota archaeon]|nr:MAG: ABC transporter [Euryarchaeota archaeon]
MIEARRLVKQFGAVTALAGLSVEVPEGRVGLLGPNGAGKSTFIKLALGIFSPTSGSVEVLGESVTTAGPTLRQRIGYMPEHDCLPDRLTGVEFVVEMAQVSGMARQAAIQRTHEVLNHLRMGEEKYRPISEYSGGMRQKVKLAQGLVHGPELVILDEPTSGLDPQARRDMLRTIRTLTELGHSNVLLSTHILHDVEKVCDHVIIVSQGRLQMVEQVESLLASLENWVEVRVGEPRDAFCKALEQRKLEWEEHGPALRVSFRGDETFGAIIAAAEESGAPLLQMERATRALEDLYLEVVK